MVKTFAGTTEMLPLVWQGAMPHSAKSEPLTAYEPDGQHRLYKLVLVVAEACNLRCTYCYAEGGPYGRGVSLMSPEVAARSMREMFGRYTIDTLQFFGGEPSLNLPAMRAALEELRAMVAEGTLAVLPKFSIVTNLMRLPDELLAFYQETDMLITVSHDGPQAIQDTLRPSVNGGASFQTVDENLLRLRDAGVSFDVQCTYTRLHARAGLTVPRLMRWFADHGARLIHIVPVSVPEGDPLDVWHSDTYPEMVEGFREAVRMHFRAIDAGVNVAFGMATEAMQLLQRGKMQSPHYCNAGVSTLTIAANGEVYPCFMFINKQGFVLGHVEQEHRLGAFARDPHEGADFGCPGREFMINGEVRTFRRDQALKEAVVDEVLTGLGAMLTKVESDLGIPSPA